MANMIKKLNIKDFSTQTIRALGIYSLADLLNLDKETAYTTFGEVIGTKLIERIEQIKNLKYPDYRIIGAIGFSSIAVEKWKKIMCNLSLETLIHGSDEKIKGILESIKGIGSAASNTIIIERVFFMKDLIAISKMPNLVCTYGEMDLKPTVRFTGVRDDELVRALQMNGYDADGDKSVTKQTNILVVPYVGYSSSKTQKVGPQCQIIPIDILWDKIKSK
jgi:hypothetical protein